MVAAFAAGVLALLSPCSALLLPSFFAYAFGSRRALLARTAVFTLGLMLTLVPLGSGVRLVSGVFYGHRELLVTVAGWVIIGFGVLQIVRSGTQVPFGAVVQNTAGGWARQRQSDGGWLGTLALGAVYGLAGFCSGPALGAILTVAATSRTPAHGGALLAVYAVGMAAPLFVLAALWDRYRLGSRSWLRGRMLTVGRFEVHSTSLVSGLLFVAIGVLFLWFDGTAGILAGTGVDTTELEFAAQESVVRVLSGIPAWSVLAVVAVGAAGLAWRGWRQDLDQGETASQHESPPRRGADRV